MTWAQCNLINQLCRFLNDIATKCFVLTQYYWVITPLFIRIFWSNEVNMIKCDYRSYLFFHSIDVVFNGFCQVNSGTMINFSFTMNLILLFTVPVEIFFFNLRDSVIKRHQKRWKKHSTHFWLWAIVDEFAEKRKYYEAIRAYAAIVCSFYMSYHQILGANQTFILFNWLNNVGQLDFILFSIWIMDLFDYIIENSIYFNPIYELFDHTWQINEITGWI